jgi:hypothetical protein
MSSTPFSRRAKHRGVALVIVLAFVVLLTGLIVAFFSQALIDRQISNSSANSTRVDLFAQGAVDAITGDLKEEIAAGSVVTNPSPSPSPATGVLLCTPNAPQSAAVCLAGSTGTAGMENLLKRSAYGVPFYANPTPAPSPTPYSANYTPSKRAANVSSTAPSLSGRYVSPARWNKALLFPKKTLTSDSDLTPVATFIAPDWVLMSRNGANPAVTALDPSLTYNATSLTSVIGRYAYNIYDEGGLLDMNVAGFPSTSTPTQESYKNALAYADLSQLKDSSGNPVITKPQIDELVAWRNYASASTDWSQPSPTPGATLGTFLLPGWNTSTATNYFNAISANASGFMSAANPIVIGGPPGQTDRVFTGRQELINLFEEGIAASGTAGQADRASLQNALQFMGTFSRGLNQPSYVPALQTNYAGPPSGPPKVLSAGSGGNAAYNLDREINPSYLAVRVTKTFTRNDGSAATIGDPLVNKRFPLERLVWLTYKGPSQGRPQTDPDIAALIADGIPYSYLQLGTAYNIKQSFGLTWSSTKWLYNVHNNGVTTGRGPIMRVGRNPAVDLTADATHYVQDLAAPRDPDFFELLKSAITVGSLGKTLVASNLAMPADTGAASQGVEPYNYNYSPEASVDRQVIQIGANIINQARADNYPVQIVFDDGVGNPNALNATSTATTIAGVADLPYLYDVMSGVLQVKAPGPLPRSGVSDSPQYDHANGTGTSGDSGYQIADNGTSFTSSGVGAMMQMPVLWNPHDPASPLPAVGPTTFCVVADSASPDVVSAGATASYSSFFASASSGTNKSYSATSDPNSAMWYMSPSQTGSEIAHKITAVNSEIDFTANSGTVQLFPEPTMLLRSATITDSNGNAVAVAPGNINSNLMKTDAAVSSFFNGGLPNYIPDPAGLGYPATTSYLGFYLGAFPWAWSYSSTAALASGAQSGPVLARVSGTSGGSPNACYLTYRVACQDPNNPSGWIYYDTKYGKVANGSVPAGNIGTTQPSGALFAPGEYWASVIDPRTSRFGIHWNNTTIGTFGSGNGAVEVSGYLAYSPTALAGSGYGWPSQANGILKTDRPDAQSGYYFMTNWLPTPPATVSGMPTAATGWMAWVASNGSAYAGIAPGLFAQNNTDIPYAPSRSYGDPNGNLTHTPNYFADADGMVRRGMGAYVPIGLSSSPTNPSGDTRLPSGDTTVGLPTARAFAAAPSPVSPTIINYSSGSTLSQAQSRPYFLHRPFRSVAELGCVFSDTPWRNLDFFTSESGASALLDVFCVNENNTPTGLVAGKIDLNTKQSQVLTSVFAGAALDLANVGGNNSVTQPMDQPTASSLAAALIYYTSANGHGPLANIGDLVGRWNSNLAIVNLGSAITGTNKGTLTAPSFYDGKLSYTGFSGGQWDSVNHQPKVTSPAADVYSAYMGSGSFSTNAEHNGTQQTAAYIQRFREAPIRALATAGQTRVWNLMIDLVAQTGRYPASASTLNNFVVEGEQRYWVHLAIDRATGLVVDKQVEIVKE